ncbi:MAG TPA: TIGR03668 family PPOX class F420-dependent oxidoreductase [Dehalococcoidia bacterium]|nr:PPOX class F420-dependent enzyme [Chloroflexota bacterium]HCE75977.1 TIGR03668 family PPOX class F420-dependent oxidoreductase [Dehalococcoidia bacterium]|tara:strand:- start:5531 stop:5956 length:426 start_codon:yes stop_codon:yes gene_type:complete
MLKKVEEFILSCDVARLSTVTPAGLPHSIPICFALSGLDIIYTPIDSKPKSSSKKTLIRINNIINNDEVVVLFDRYSEDWNELGYVMVKGKASIVQNHYENLDAVTLLEGKYRQYREENYLPPDPTVIKVKIYDYTSWGNF